MSVNYNVTLPPFPYTSRFTSDWQTQPLQSLVVKLALSPGTYQLSVLPDLIVLTSATGAVGPDDVNGFFEEVLISSAYVTRSVNWWDSTGGYHPGENWITNLRMEEDTLATQTMESAGIHADAGSFEYYTATFGIEAERTITYPSGARDVYTDDYYLHVYGWNLSYPLGTSGVDVPFSGRFMIALGNPTGQRSQTWGGDWLNVQSLFENYEPPLPPPPIDDGMVLFGDTPMLLREGVTTFPSEATFQPAYSTTFVTSPEISTDLTKIGSLVTSGPTETWEIIKDAGASAALGVVAELIADNPYANMAVKTADVVEVGEYINETSKGAIGFIEAGMDVLQGKMAYSDFNEQWNSWSSERESTIDTMAESKTVGSIPGIGWVLSPIVEAYQSLSFKLEVTHSFKVSITSDQSITGGQLGNVILAGNKGANIAMGNGNSLAQGGTGDDSFTVGTGDDYINGGAGFDITTFSATRASNTLTRAAGGWTVSSSVDGTDTVTNVEYLQFADTAVTISPANSFDEYTALLYQGALGRTPDPGGLAGWIRLTAALPAATQAMGVYGLSDASGNFNGNLSIAAGFTNSPEFITKYGSLTNAQFVTQLYANILDRAPDPTGLVGWQSYLTGGTTREHVLVGFALSQEAIANATVGYVGIHGQHDAWLMLS